MGDEMDLEALWDASPDGLPPDVPVGLGPLLDAGRPHAGIFRGPTGALVIVCALASERARRYAKGEVAVQRPADAPSGYPRLLVTFLPDPAMPAEGEPSPRPFAIGFNLDDAEQRQLWREFVAQGEAVVSYLDVDEAVMVRRRVLRLGEVAAGIERAICDAERNAGRSAVPGSA